VTPWYDHKSIIVKHINEEGGLGVLKFDNAQNEGDWIIQPTLTNSKQIKRLLPKNAPFSTFRICTGFNPQTKETYTLCAVFRAGRKGATTDHSCILFDTDMKTGVINPGTLQWKRVEDILEHPDTGMKIAGQRIEKVPEMCRLCTELHEALVPNIPIAGWDITELDDGTLCFLETNLSANLHKGNFDREKYFQLVKANIIHHEGIVYGQEIQD